MEKSCVKLKKLSVGKKLNNKKYSYIGFHDLVTEYEYSATIINMYKNFEFCLKNNICYSFIFYELSFLITLDCYMKLLNSALIKYKKKGYKCVYVTDISKKVFLDRYDIEFYKVFDGTEHIDDFYKQFLA